MSRSRFTLAFDHENMVPAPAASSTVHIIFKTEDGVIFCYGTGTAPSTANTYAPGCLYIKVVSAGSSFLYVNTGTYASPSWTEAGDNT